MQCKQWRAFKVGVDVVRQLYGVMAATGATGGFVVTSGRFTADAIAFADGRNVTLVDGPKLHGLIRQAKAAAVGGVPQPVTAPFAPPPGRSAAVDEQAPTCSVCAKLMVLRTAKRGSHAGRMFWGCTGFPQCRSTQPVGDEER